MEDFGVEVGQVGHDEDEQRLDDPDAAGEPVGEDGEDAGEDGEDGGKDGEDIKLNFNSPAEGRRNTYAITVTTERKRDCRNKKLLRMT